MAKKILFIDNEKQFLPNEAAERRLKWQYDLEIVRADAVDPLESARKFLEQDPHILGVVSDSILIQKQEGNRVKKVSEHMEWIRSKSPFIRVALYCTVLDDDKRQFARDLGVTTCCYKGDHEGIEEFIRSFAESVDIVTSYGRQDDEAARILETALANERLSVYPDAAQLVAGKLPADRFEKKVEVAEACVLIVGDGRPDEPRRKEWAAVLRKSWKDRSFRLFPVILDDAPVPALVLNWAVHRTSRSPQELEQSARTIGKALRRETRELGQRTEIPAERLREAEERLQKFGQAFSAET